MHHFNSDRINNMDHLRISGTKPSSVILSQTKLFQKLQSYAQKVQKQAKAKRDYLVDIMPSEISTGSETNNGIKLIDIFVKAINI